MPIIGLPGVASIAAPSARLADSTPFRKPADATCRITLTPVRISCTFDAVDDDVHLQDPDPPADSGHAKGNVRGDGRRLPSFKRIAAKFHRRGVILERRLTEPILDVAPRCAVEFGQLDRSDIEEYARFHPDRPREYIERRLATGDLCFAARHRGTLASTTWACRSRHWVPDLHFMWQVAPGEVYLYDSYTARPYRNRGIGPALDTHVLRTFRSLDVERALTAVAPDNTASLRAKVKVGFRPCGDLSCFSIGWGIHLHRRRTFASPPTTDVQPR